MSELYKETRKRLQRGNKEILTDKDIIELLATEIKQYREKIKRLTYIAENKKELDKELEISINNEDYLIKYNKDTDAVILNACLTRLVNEKTLKAVHKDNEFKIYNLTRLNNIIDYDIE